ncbi:DUF4336 domain-containing protein [Antarctobacter jejuensis]|uniref:DUF4336 domain-containing protein n=1 Tax=Antarctobacter jejuensis TaxID=1439938 RepID=UPI003FD51AA2
MLQSLGRDLWTVEGQPICAAAGFMFPTRMCLARLPDGGIWVHSPVALTDEVRAEVASLGPVRYLVAPNDLHHVYLPLWCAAYPRAQVHAAPGVPKKCPFAGEDAPLGDSPPEVWKDSFDQVMFAGNLITTEIVFLHRPSGTAIFTDLLQQMPPDWYSGWRGTVARLDLMTSDSPKVPRKYRLAFRDRPALRAALARVRAWPIQKLVMAHGPVIETNAAEVVDRAFSWAD